MERSSGSWLASSIGRAVVCACLLTLAPGTTAYALCGRTDAGTHEPADSAAPAAGESYVDPAFGCSVKRLTEGRVKHGYSSVNPFNSDSSYVLVEASGGMLQVRDLAGGVVRGDLHLVGILPTSSAVWSRTDPRLLYFHPAGGNQLKSYDVTSGEVRELRTFEAYGQVSFGLGEGDISWDGDHLAVVGDGRWGFIHTISAGTDSPAVDLSKYGAFIDNVDLTPQNRLTMIHDQPGGTELFDPSMTHVGLALDFQGHSDRGRDLNGEDMIVITNSADPTPIADCQNGIVKKALPGGAETCLLPLAWSLAVHVSCNAVGREWCLVSTYAQPGAQPVPYMNELLLVMLDGRPPLRLAHTRSSNRDYESLPRAAASADGRFVLFDSDMGGGTPSVYLLDLGDSAPETAQGKPEPEPEWEPNVRFDRRIRAAQRESLAEVFQNDRAEIARFLQDYGVSPETDLLVTRVQARRAQRGRNATLHLWIRVTPSGGAPWLAQAEVDTKTGGLSLFDPRG